jgi:hydroxymethylpyrimidine/phosphomethylpyrimidine kinase
MGHALPDRMFWAEMDDDATETDERLPTAEDFSLPRHETKH